MRKVAILPDIHLDHRFPLHSSYLLAKKFLKWWKPDEIVLLGDFFDFAVISKYAEGKPGELFANGIQYSITKDKRLAEREIDSLLKLTKTLTYLEGNHDRRIADYGKKHPEISELVAVPELLDLKSRRVQYVKEMDQPYRLGDLSLIHGWFFNKYPAAKTLDDFGGSITFGHTHTMQMHTKTLKATGQELVAYNLGCLTDKNPGYGNGRPNRHVNGFGIAYLEKDGQFSLYPIHITNNQFIYGGRKWQI